MPGRRDFRGACLPFQNGREDFKHNFHEKRVVVYPPRVEISPGIMLMCGKVTLKNLIDGSHYFRNTD